MDISADVKGGGYLVGIRQHGGKEFALRPAKGFRFLGDYKPFWNLNIQIADLNRDRIPEIVVWGSMTHENPLHIFRWDGRDYRIVYSGFDTGFDFRDITGDQVPELVIHDRIYGVGEERRYFQWKKCRYEQIDYRMDAGRSFEPVEALLGEVCALHADPSAYEDAPLRVALRDIFSEEWLADGQNLKKFKAFGKRCLSAQITRYIGQKSDFNAAGKQIGAVFKLNILVFVRDGEKIYPQEMTMTAETTLIDNCAFKIIDVSVTDGRAAGEYSQWWNRRTPVKAIAMPYLSQVAMTWSSRIEPPVWAT